MATRLKRIPDKIILVSRPQSKRYDLSAEGPSDFRDTYPVDAANKRRLESARDWAGFKPTSGRFTSNPRGTYDEEEIENTPRLYRIINLEERGEGGRAYKVSDLENRVYDLREDALLDSWKIAGMNPGGELNAEFVWTLQGSEMKLCVVGSKTHQRLVEEDAKFESDEVAGLNKIKTTTKYEVGKTYSTPNGTTHYIYLGEDKAQPKYPHLWLEYHKYGDGTVSITNQAAMTTKIPRVLVDDPDVNGIPLKESLDKVNAYYQSQINYQKGIVKRYRVYPSDYTKQYQEQLENYEKALESWTNARIRLGLPT